MNRSAYIDQWRGLSVIMVIVNHLLIYRFDGVFRLARAETAGSKMLFKAGWFVDLWSINAGTVGVCAFFVISGYLITALMLREEQKTGRVSLVGFYIRRVFRIFPAMLIYVSVVTALSATDALGSRPSEAVEALSFACNTSWVDCHHGPFNHFWSLAVEEQFYLFWPLLLILSHGRYRVAIVLATLVVSTITSPIDSLRVHGWLSNGLAVACLAAGALYALSYRFRSAFAPLSRIPTAVFIGLVCLVVPFVLTRWGGAQVATLRLLPFLIVAAVLARSGSVTRFIGLGRILNRVGLVSYSLYLWHALSALRPEFYLSPAFVWTAWLAIPLAWISYRFVELPFIKIGQLLEARFRSWSLAPTFS